MLALYNYLEMRKKLLIACMFAGFVLSIIMSCPAHAAQQFNEQFDEQSGALLEERIAYWYGRGRPDRLNDYLAQLLRVYPNHPRLLEVQSLLALQAGDMDEAERLYLLLKQFSPNSLEVLRLEEMVALNDQQRIIISDARMLSLVGRYQESINKWHEVFPRGPQSISLALEYWDVFVREGQAEEALMAVTKLSHAYPYFIPAKLALVRIRLALDKVAPMDQHFLVSLLGDAVYGVESLGLARRMAGNLPVTAANLQFIHEVLEHHPDHAELLELSARMQVELEEHAAMVRSGAFAKKEHGFNALDNGQPLIAERWLREAWQAGGHTVEIAGGLGYAVMRQGRHAEALGWFYRAQRMDPTTQLWRDMISVTTFWRDLQIFNTHLADGNDKRAQIALNRLKAHPHREENEGLLSLKEGELIAFQDGFEPAVVFFERALNDPQSAEQAAWILFAYYRDQSDTQAMGAFYSTLSRPLQIEFKQEYKRFLAIQYQQQATVLFEQGEHEQAYYTLLLAYELAPFDAWLVAAIADYEITQGRRVLAQDRFHRLVSDFPSNDAWFAYALLLSSVDQPHQALAVLNQIPTTEMTEGNEQLAARLEHGLLLEKFATQWRQLLEGQPKLISGSTPAQQTAFLNIIANQAQPSDKGYLTHFEQAIETAKGDEKAEIYALSSEFAEAIGNFNLAYMWSLEAIQEQRLLNEINKPVWQVDATDSWRASGLRRRAMNAASQNEKVFTIGFDQSEKSGTPGITELSSKTLMLHLKVPFKSRPGDWFIQIDPITLNAGQADLDNNYWRNRYGTGLLCEENCPTGLQPTNKDKGIALGVGANFERWWFDVGLSPIGFNRSEWVGSIGHNFSLGEFGANIKLDRRVLTSTKISFAGQQDPFSERAWGPVLRQGVGLGLSWDQGERFGWWASLGADLYSGYQLASNSGWYAYTGGYMRAVDTEPLAITVGLTTLFWGFEKDLSEVSFGHGNYYSPRLYGSISVPVTLYGRYERWSYSLRTSIGYSRSRLAAQKFYPAHADLQQAAIERERLTGVQPYYAKGTGGGRSHSLTGSVEYQINKHWYAGLSMNLVRSDTFSPNQGLVYLRYHFGGFNLPVSRPPAPPSAYMNR